jgi:hypothetical protein
LSYSGVTNKSPKAVLSSHETGFSETVICISVARNKKKTGLSFNMFREMEI